MKRKKFPTERQINTDRLRFAICHIALARAKEANGDPGNYARFDWQAAWDRIAWREGVQ